MRIRKANLAAIVGVIVGIASFAHAAATYYNPHLWEYPANFGVVGMVRTFQLATAVFAAIMAWMAIRFAQELGSNAAHGRTTATNLIGKARMTLLLVLAAYMAFALTGLGGEQVVWSWSVLIAYVAVLGLALLAAIVEGAVSLRSAQAASNAGRRPISLALAIGLLLIAYPAALLASSTGASSDEVRLSEAVLKAAKAGQTEIRLLDSVMADEAFACLVADHHSREDVEKAIGVRYVGPWHGESDVYQLLLFDGDGQGRTVRFFAGEVDARNGDALCASTQRAYLQLTISSWQGRMAVSAKLHEKSP